MEIDNTKTEEKGNDTNTMLAAVRQYEKIDERVRHYLYAKLYKLYNEQKLNKGILPSRKASDVLCINSFCSDGNKISVAFDIAWPRGSYDEGTLSMTNEEWDAI